MCRELIAAVLGVAPSSLQRRPEKCSVKPAGCKALEPHWDLDRVGGVQCVIALTPGAFLVWPRSHKPGPWRSIPDGEKGFLKLTKEQIAALPEPVANIPANVGDVLLMQGGTSVHGSPEVLQGSVARVVAYANFDPDKT